MFFWRRPSSAMPAPEKEKDREEEEGSTESSYEEVEEEVEAKHTPTLVPTPKGVAKKAAARPPSEVGISSSESVSPAPTRPPRGHGGCVRLKSPPHPPKRRELPRGRSPAPAASAAKASRKPSSSDSSPGEGIHKGRNGSQKGRGKKGGHQRCEICWSKVALGDRCLKQHQRWNTTCIAWGFHNRGMAWEHAQMKALRTKERRERKAWAGVPEEAAPSRPSPVKFKAERKEERKRKDKKKRRVSPSPEARAPDGKRCKKDPDNSSDGDRLPKVRARGQDIIIRMPRAR